MNRKYPVKIYRAKYERLIKNIVLLGVEIEKRELEELSKLLFEIKRVLVISEQGVG